MGGATIFSFHAYAPAAALVSSALAWGMLVIAAIAARRFTIPDVLLLPAIVLGLLASGFIVDPSMRGLSSVASTLGGSCLWLVREVYRHLRGREGLGLGDVTLAAAGGAWTGWQR